MGDRCRTGALESRVPSLRPSQLRENSPLSLGLKEAIQRELEQLGSSRSIASLEICNMLWFVVTDKEIDQTPQRKGSNLLAETAGHITDMLKRYKEAGPNWFASAVTGG